MYPMEFHLSCHDRTVVILAETKGGRRMVHNTQYAVLSLKAVGSVLGDYISDPLRR